MKFQEEIYLRKDDEDISLFGAGKLK